MRSSREGGHQKHRCILKHKNRIYMNVKRNMVFIFRDRVVRRLGATNTSDEQRRKNEKLDTLGDEPCGGTPSTTRQKRGVGGKCRGSCQRRDAGAVRGRELHSRVCVVVVYLDAGGLWCSYSVMKTPTNIYKHQ